MKAATLSKRTIPLPRETLGQDKRFKNIVYTPNSARTQMEAPKSRPFRVIRTNSSATPIRDCKRKIEDPIKPTPSSANNMPSAPSCEEPVKENKKVCLDRSRSPTISPVNSPLPESKSQDSSTISPSPVSPSSSSLPSTHESPVLSPLPNPSISLGEVNWDEFFSATEVATFGLTADNMVDPLNISQEEEELFREALSC